MELDRDEIIYLKFMLLSGESYTYIRKQAGTSLKTIDAIANFTMYDNVLVPSYEEEMELRQARFSVHFKGIDELKVAQIYAALESGESISSVANTFRMDGKDIQDIKRKYISYYGGSL